MHIISYDIFFQKFLKTKKLHIVRLLQENTNDLHVLLTFPPPTSKIKVTMCVVRKKKKLFLILQLSNQTHNPTP